MPSHELVDFVKLKKPSGGAQINEKVRVFGNPWICGDTFAKVNEIIQNRWQSPEFDEATIFVKFIITRIVQLPPPFPYSNLPRYGCLRNVLMFWGQGRSDITRNFYINATSERHLPTLRQHRHNAGLAVNDLLHPALEVCLASRKACGLPATSLAEPFDPITP